ncbi:MAG: dihydrolipoyl dehydrogenase [Acidobacteriota bacterium]
MESNKDLVIIGAGPGGYVAAIRAAQLGLSTTLVEKDKRLGGTCLLRGCIPTKALLETAYLYTKARSFKEFGITIGAASIDWPTVQQRKDRLVLRLAKGVESLMKKNQVEVINGRAHLAGTGLVEIVAEGGSSRRIAAKNVLIATGSEPKIFPPFDVHHPAIITSNEALELMAIPSTIAVVGAGAVGVEFASIFQAVGSQVTIIEILDHILPFEDPDVAAALHAELAKRGIRIHAATRVDALTPMENAVRLRITGPKETAEADFEKVLVAVGRRPVTENMGLDKLGIAVEKGFIKVDEYCRTNVPGHYAIGDCIATPQLAHVASAEGKMAVERIASSDARPLNYDQVPFCTYCDPEVARVGLTEAEARKRGAEVGIGKFPFAALGKAGIVGHREGFVKIIADKRFGEILGCSIIGPHATELISEPASFMAAEGTMWEMLSMMHAHPTLYESILEAAEAWTGHPIHM